MGVKHQLVVQKVYVHNTEPAFVTMRLATRNLRETDTEVFSVLRVLSAKLCDVVLLNLYGCFSQPHRGLINARHDIGYC